MHDILFVADTQTMCHAALCVAYDTFTSVGMKIKPSKLVHPTQVIDFVGVRFNSITGQMGVTEARRETLISELKILLSNGFGTFQDWERLLGRLTFISEAVPGLGGALQPLHRLLPIRKQHRLARIRQKLVHVEMNRAVCLSLGWILRRLQERCYRVLHTAADGSFYMWTKSFGMTEAELVHNSQATVVMDASGEIGWGVSWVEAGESRAGQWSSGWKEQHINPKELYCFLVSLRHFGKTWKRAGIERILAFTDNTPTVGCLNKLRSPSNGMNQICQRIRQLLCQFGLELVAVHKPGVDNVLADGLSRGTIAPCTNEVSLSRLGLQKALQCTGDLYHSAHYQEAVPVSHSFKHSSTPAFAAGSLVPDLRLGSDRLVGVVPRGAAVPFLKRARPVTQADESTASMCFSGPLPASLQ